MSRRPLLDAALAGLPVPAVLHRRIYRLAFALLKGWWFCRRPRTLGACVVVGDGDRVLVVQVSYRDGYALPGGGIGRGETPLEAALRELREETGLEPTSGELVELDRIRAAEQFRRIETVLFAWRPSSLPTPRIDGREIVWAGYRNLRELEGARMTPGLAHLVETSRRRAPATGQACAAITA
jgi:8-oxo-dGTP diphosphatase